MRMQGCDLILGILARGLITVLLAIPSGTTSAQEASPVGLWKTFSDRTGQADGLVRIVEERGEYIGRVEKVFSPPNDTPNPRCERCPGDLREKPVVGMAILRGIRRAEGGFTQGTILDPEEGETYTCTLMLKDGGVRLEIRGF